MQFVVNHFELLFWYLIFHFLTDLIFPVPSVPNMPCAVATSVSKSFNFLSSCNLRSS